MFNENHYVPILKWRMGEYQALFKLEPAVKDWVTPLLEIPTEGWNFETEAPAKTLDDHLANFGDRLLAKWAARSCFVDSPYIDGTACIANGQHHLLFVFDRARAVGCVATPVTGLQRPAQYQSAVAQISAIDQYGICLRLELEDFDANLPQNLNALMTTLGSTPQTVDMVIDMKDQGASAPSAQAHLLFGLLSQVNSQPWRTITIAATSFPAALGAATYRPHGRSPRREWLAYKELLQMLPPEARKPTFGDYATSHPATFEMDPRMLDPNAKIKYTLEDEWIIFVGQQVRRFGRGQYQTLCRDIIAFLPPFFHGAPYSWGDSYIENCATGVEGTGGTSTWPSVATNHHVTVAVRGVANFHGTLASP